MKDKKLKAFTLAEMLVVLVLASIIIAMGFLVLNMVKSQVISIQNNYQKKQEVQFFEATLTRDFNARNAFYNKDNNHLILKNTKDSVLYVFKDYLIIRNRDTFKIEVTNKKFFLNGKIVKENTIDAIEMNLSENYGEKFLFMHKVKDASYYINHKKLLDTVY
ncbi:type II secretion system protein J [Polaribacter sp. Asnod6-C07]|uniref:PulJ/GspJ family protein n=1 Tax=Polaribacter sp. Asnod6-C07 TaxID=3160582 RepID=UPI003867DB4F